jgi:hypothetical protein
MTECKAPPTLSDMSSGPNSAPGACLVLGLAGALLVSALPDAVLLPAVDRLPPRHVGLLVTGLRWPRAGAAEACRPAALGCRDAPAAGGRRGALGRCLASVLAPGARGAGAALRATRTCPTTRWWRPRSRWWLRRRRCRWAPLAPAGRPRRCPPPRSCLRRPGLGAAPWLLRVARPATPPASGGPAVRRRRAAAHGDAPRPVTRRTLPAGAAFALPLAGLALLVGVRLLDLELDRGALVAPWLASVAALGAAAGSLLPPLPAAATLLGAAAVLVPVAFPAGDWILPVPARAPAHDLLHALLVAGPCGLCPGPRLRRGGGPRRGRRCRSRRCCCGAAATGQPVAAASPRRARRWRWRPRRCCSRSCAAASSWSAAGAAHGGRAGARGRVAGPRRRAPGRASGVPARRQRGPRARPRHGPAAARAGRPRAFGRSSAQMRRMAHLPPLLHGDPSACWSSPPTGRDGHRRGGQRADHAALAAALHAPRRLELAAPRPCASRRSRPPSGSSRRRSASPTT